MRRPSFLFGCKIRPGKARISFGEKHISGGFRFGTRGLSVLFGSAGKKSETSEHKPNFGNKTAGRGRLKQEFGLPISDFHRTSGIVRRKYAVNSGTLEHAVLFM